VNTSSSSTDEVKWYPQQKLDIARKKLEGVNPAGKLYNLDVHHAIFIYFIFSN
jgi:hypothetical protein